MTLIPGIKQISQVGNDMYAQGAITIAGIGTTEVSYLADPADTRLLAGRDPVLEEVSVGISGVETDLKYATGPQPLTVTDAMQGNLTYCEVQFSPKQDLHGYSNPWPAGGGKNILDCTVKTSSGVTAEKTDDGKYYIHGTAGASSFPVNFVPMDLPAGTYTFSVVGDVTSMQLAYTKNGSWSGVISPSNTFTLTETTTIGGYVNVINGDTVNTTIGIQLEVGSSASDWSPYSNLCPISGWQGAEVTVSGGNLFNENSDAPLMNVYNYLHQVQARRGIRIDVPAGEYTAKANGIGDDAFLNLNVINADGTFSTYGGLVAGSSTYTQTVTVTTGQYIVIYDQQASTASTATKFAGWNIQLELGSPASSYVPYRAPSTSTVTFGQTVYGGTAEIVSGTGSEAWITFTLNGTQTRNNQKLDGAYNAVARWDLPVQAKAFTPGVPPYLCESLRAVSSTLIGSFQSWSDSESHAYTFTFSDDGRRVGIAIPKSVGISTAAELDTWLSNNPITFCYEVAAPTPYTFPGANDITLQDGTNTIWADTNGTDISVTYVTKK